VLKENINFSKKQFKGTQQSEKRASCAPSFSCVIPPPSNQLKPPLPKDKPSLLSFLL